MLRNLRYLLRLTKAFISKFKIIILLSVIFGFLFFLAIFFVIPRFFNKTNERIGITGRFTTNDIPQSILLNISSGLTSINDSGKPIGALAKSFETTDNGKTWVFELKDNIYWQDGEKITSKSIDYNFEDLTLDNSDPKKIIFKLKSPFSPFPVIVSKPIFKKGLLGNGLWQVSNISLSSNYVESLLLKDKKGNTKTFKFYPSEDSTKTAFKLGQIDKISDLIDPSPFTNWKTAKFQKNIDEHQVVAVFFNTKEGGPLSDKNIRQGLYYAIDKSSLGERAVSSIAPTSWAYNSQTKPYDYDPKKAKDLLSDFVKKTAPITLLTTPSLLDNAQKIVNDWQKIGVKAQVQVTLTIPTDYQALLAIYDIPQDPDQYTTWHSTQIETNITRYSNPRIDKLLEDGRTEVDQEKRKKIYLDFQRFLSEDAPAAFLYHPAYYTVTKK
ncbi:ABC transporter substrate-binding protein [Candidatus Woesebacteria bacterium]|nr:ABC transporter substrate-binding protein [Candidatus Woesebacteria bacterium]QQG47183.1 MAG: ABC transporter substrate-binding protein [Candidatus Woesebacteria bacterium]